LHKGIRWFSAGPSSGRDLVLDATGLDLGAGEDLFLTRLQQLAFIATPPAGDQTG
jgi:hypothetical protein